jgi:hypothetical protein
MDPQDKGLRHLLEYWFSGLMSGLAVVDEEAREKILRECGRACAQSYTAQAFLDVRRQSADLDGFLARLALNFPEAAYERIGPCSVKVSYVRCECDLATSGLVDFPLLCACSAYNLQENFARSLGIPVTVTLQSSILRGEPNCTLLVSWDE